MKMFKKIAATVMAAAMSLAMLTACGGGGGGSTTQYKMAKVLAESQKTGKVYSDITTTIDGGLFNKNWVGKSIQVNAKTAADSKAGKTCTLLEVQGDKTMFMVTNDGFTYEISTDETNEPYWSKIGSNAMLGAAASAVPSNSNISKLQIRPDYEYNGTSYYAEVITADGTEIAYCFDGDNLVYIVMNVSGVQIAEKVNEISGHFPAQVDPELPMSYDEVMNLPTRG